MPHQMIDQCQLCAPVIGKTAQMRNDKVHIRVFLREQFAHGHLAHDVVQHRQAEGAGGGADAPRDARIVPMQFDADHPELDHRLRDQGADAALIAQRIGEGEAEQTVRLPCDDACHFAVGRGIVGIEGREYDGPVDACLARTLQIDRQRRARIPGPGETVARSRMAMAIDDHAGCLFVLPNTR